jgi:hypothetical protein
MSFGKKSQKSLHERVYTRLIRIEDLLVCDSDERNLYHLLQKLYKHFLLLQHHHLPPFQEGGLTCLEIILFSHKLSDICEWFLNNFQIQITETEAKILKNYLKVCSRDKYFDLHDSNDASITTHQLPSLLIPPPISEYSIWCERLRYLRSQPPPLSTQKLFQENQKKKRKQKFLVSYPPLLSTSRISPYSSPDQTPRVGPPKKTLSSSLPLVLPPIPVNLKTETFSTSPSHSSLPPPFHPPSLRANTPPSWKAKIRLVAIENEQIRKEVFKILGVTT